MLVSNCLSAKNLSRTSVPVALLRVWRPGTHVRTILKLGVGSRNAPLTRLMALTVRAVPFMTEPSSLTGITTMPPAEAAM